ncbi:nucleotide exchange factor GrpE [Buchnera aphidicola (Brachycaudus cardui)]|uniref:Protein GrpE n=1 Tax=Buchnera aphidicola (Brachycaudus cardui) TaxID=557993 RepID=A0A4D6Y1C6_9GAMM|nr:nucleotide exchange factor GrpE [Buchnera aphidicola]QCI20394.1 nucleotide exchange factor GrpE [Buchnera aphidicola (Brachycaudus cardui)]
MINKDEKLAEKEININEKYEKNKLINENLIKSLENKLRESEKEILEKEINIEKEMITIFSRSHKEIEKYRKFSLEQLLSELLPISDSIERALSLIDEDKSNKIFIEIKDNITNIFDLLKEFFLLFHVKKIDSFNVPFDPSIHQAMSIKYSNEIEPNQVVTIMQPGYILHECRLLRPAMVIVSNKKI